jgi:hypothetical protein
MPRQMLRARFGIPPHVHKSGMTEREVQHDPQVLEGDDESPHQPASPLDPYTPEPGPGPGEARPFRVLRLAWIVVAIVVAIVLTALLR